MKKTELTQDRLKELLSYDPETGVFRWRVSRQCVRAGAIAGGHDTCGYRQIKIDGRLRKASRLVWLYIYGRFPTKEIDHMFGNRDDNRLSKLREATRAQNNQNTGRRKDNSSGLKGVSWHKGEGKWSARINVDKRCIFLGYYSTPREAGIAYEAAAKKSFGKFWRAA